jgi:hypothetical protein
MSNAQLRFVKIQFENFDFFFVKYLNYFLMNFVVKVSAGTKSPQNQLFHLTFFDISNTTPIFGIYF